jgi:hypothetical protein
MPSEVMGRVQYDCDPTLYPYLVSHFRDRKAMIVRRIYRRGELLLECEKEFVDLTKTPDAKETDVWKCVFRKNRMRMNTSLAFHAMASAFRSFGRELESNVRLNAEIIPEVERMCNEGKTVQEIMREKKVTSQSLMRIMHYLAEQPLDN